MPLRGFNNNHLTRTAFAPRKTRNNRSNMQRPLLESQNNSSNAYRPKKTLKRGVGSRFLLPRKAKGFRWANNMGYSLTTASNNENIPEENYSLEHLVNLRNSRLSRKHRGVAIGNVGLTPRLSKIWANILEKYNDPADMQEAINARRNLTDEEFNALIGRLAFLYQDFMNE